MSNAAGHVQPGNSVAAGQVQPVKDPSPQPTVFRVAPGRRLWLFGSLLCTVVGSASAQTQLDRFFPAVIQRGGESNVTAEGKFPHWPPSVRCDRKDVEIKFGKDTGKLTIRVPDEASPGVAWIRFFDDDSATALTPLVIETAAVTEESEPNDKRSDANALVLPTVVAGRLSKGGESDAYRVSVKAGQQLVASVTANQVLRSPMDAVLQLTDPLGNVLLQADDTRGLDPQIVYSSKTDQELLIRIFAFPETPTGTVGFAGSAAFVYNLTVTTGPFLDHVADSDGAIVPHGYNLDPQTSVTRAPGTDISPPLACMTGALGWSWLSPSSDTIRRALSSDEFHGGLPIIISGHVTHPQQTFRLSLPVEKDTRYRAQVRSKADGFLLDSTLTIVDAETGKVIASNDDASRGNYDASVDFSTKQNGTVEVRLSDMLDGFGPRHFYQLTLRRTDPGFRLTMGSDRFTLSQDKTLEIPVTVDRDRGFNANIRVSASGLPACVKAESVVSAAKGETSKTVKLKLTLAEAVDVHGSLRVSGTPLNADDKPAGESVVATYPLRSSIDLRDFWLTVPPAPNEKAPNDKVEP